MKIRPLSYPIEYIGRWNSKDKAIFLAATVRFCAALSRYTKLNPEETCRQVFGTIRVTTGNLKGLNAHVNKVGEMTIVRNKITVELIIHELAHLFDYLCGLKPTNDLLREGIWDEDGCLVSGCKDGFFTRYNNMRTPTNGFKSSDWTKGDQIHPGVETGDPEFEALADDVMNWVRRNFVDNKAGRAIYKWVDDHIVMWLEERERVRHERRNQANGVG